MPNVIVIGSQWGDEGKGKLVDILADQADCVVRFQGGNNAGHTVMFEDKKFVLHLIPSGILQEGTKCVIGNGMVVDPVAFLSELQGLVDLGIDPKGRLFISESAHVIMPYHKILDAAREARLEGNKKIGTTVRGIGPAYEDKVGRQGIRFIDIENDSEFKERLDQVVQDKNLILKHVLNYQGDFLKEDEVFEELLTAYKEIQPYLADTCVMVNDEIKKGSNVLFEGAQGTFLDIDHGTYPYVTSSNTTAGGACTGSGVGPNKIDDVVGVVKAYTTRVGGGPFPTELFDADGEYLAKKGHEFGATTGRARRCGWFDACLLKEAVRSNGLTQLAITKLDVLDDLPMIKYCVAYEDENGNRLERLPKKASQIDKIKPIYEELPGWQSETVGITDYNSLPQAARTYIERLSEILETPISMVSTGPKREETITLLNPF